ncbi:ABC transporter ATP-binding protein [Rhodobacteraceae bacterium R_SAG6]|nr:ABC transporter ATP-binding protein [Rhodobacteraceae bacterium R_SAG6]
MSDISVRELNWSADGRRLVQDVTFSVNRGEALGLIGPNGSGKSSLLRCVAGITKPDSGEIAYGGNPLSKLSTRARAHHLAFVEQMQHSTTGMRVSDIVALGRIPYRRRLSLLAEEDHAIVQAAMDTMDLIPLADRMWRNMSGGERQRANIARALAQRAKVLVLDEPTNHLDVRHQLDVLRLVRDLPQAVVICLHDLSLAARYCDRLIVMQDGRMVAHGSPEAVLTPELFHNVFAIDARLQVGPDGKRDVQIAH